MKPLHCSDHEIRQAARMTISARLTILASLGLFRPMGSDFPMLPSRILFISWTASSVYISLLFVYLVDHKDCNPPSTIRIRKTVHTYKI